MAPLQAMPINWITHCIYSESICDMAARSEGVLDIATYACLLQLDILCLGINRQLQTTPLLKPGSYTVHISRIDFDPRLMPSNIDLKPNNHLLGLYV